MKGAAVAKESDLYKNLLSALGQFGDPYVSLLVESYEPRFFRLAATLQIATEYLPEKVRSEVEGLLRERFSFEARNFGQPVHQSEVIGLIQSVRGVLSVIVREFYRSDLPVSIEPRLPAALPQFSGGKACAAELLTLDPRPLQLEVTQ
jgi:hypothetical protein